MSRSGTCWTQSGSCAILKYSPLSKYTILCKGTNTWQLVVAEILFAYLLISAVTRLASGHKKERLEVRQNVSNLVTIFLRIL